MRERGTDEFELARAKGQITGSFALGLEDTSSRMGRLGTIELVHGRYTSVDETLERIAAVGAGDVRALPARLADSCSTRVQGGRASRRSTAPPPQHLTSIRSAPALLRRPPGRRAAPPHIVHRTPHRPPSRRTMTPNAPSRPTRVAVLGASGRMGAAACRAVEEAPDLE